MGHIEVVKVLLGDAQVDVTKANKVNIPGLGLLFMCVSMSSCAMVIMS